LKVPRGVQMVRRKSPLGHAGLFRFGCKSYTRADAGCAIAGQRPVGQDVLSTRNTGSRPRSRICAAQRYHAAAKMLMVGLRRSQPSTTLDRLAVFLFGIGEAADSVVISGLRICREWSQFPSRHRLSQLSQSGLLSNRATAQPSPPRNACCSARLKARSIAHRATQSPRRPVRGRSRRRSGRRCLKLGPYHFQADRLAATIGSTARDRHAPWLDRISAAQEPRRRRMFP
jgi:hypothetical protein